MLTDDRLKMTDEKADDHNDMIIVMIITLILMRNTLLIFGDLPRPTLQMITYCCETGNGKQGWGRCGLGHESSGRGKILRQQDNRICTTDGKYLNIIKAEGERGKGVGPRSKTL